MPKCQKSNATFWVIFKHCRMLTSLAYETFKDFFNHCDCCKRWLLFAERFNDSLFSLTVDESPFLAANYGCKMDICTSQCLKITENVAFNIASKASCVYILSGQKFIKNAKDGPFWRVLENATFWAIFKHCDVTCFRFTVGNCW